MSYSLVRRAIGCLILASASGVSAQVFYEPVQSQYEYHGKNFYYGGRDARVIGHAMRDIDRTSYTAITTTTPIVYRQRIYSDVVPFENLADNSRSSYRSYSPADAQNEANANVPTYFRKRDLLRAAQLTVDGTFVVAADARPRVEVKVHVAIPEPTAHGAILIIPRKLLDQHPKTTTTVASGE